MALRLDPIQRTHHHADDEIGLRSRFKVQMMRVRIPPSARSWKRGTSPHSEKAKEPPKGCAPSTRCSVAVASSSEDANALSFLCPRSSSG